MEPIYPATVKPDPNPPPAPSGAAIALLKPFSDKIWQHQGRQLDDEARDQSSLYNNPPFDP